MTGQVTSHNPYAENSFPPDDYSAHHPIFPGCPNNLQSSDPNELQSSIIDLRDRVQSLWRIVPWPKRILNLTEGLLQQKACIEELGRENVRKNEILRELSRDIESLRLVLVSQGSALLEKTKACMEKLESSSKIDFQQQTACIEALQREKLQQDLRIQQLEQKFGLFRVMWMNQGPALLDQIKVRMAKLESSSKTDIQKQAARIERLKKENFRKDQHIQELRKEVRSLRSMGLSQMGILSERIACLESARQTDALQDNKMPAMMAVPGRKTKELMQKTLQQDHRIQQLEEEVGSLHSMGMSQTQIVLDQIGILSEHNAYLESARKTDALQHKMMRAITAVTRGTTTGVPEDSIDPTLVQLRAFIDQCNRAESQGGDSARSSLGEATSPSSVSLLEEKVWRQDTDPLIQQFDQEYNKLCENMFLAEHPDMRILREIAIDSLEGCRWKIEQRDPDNRPTKIPSEQIRKQIRSSRGDLTELQKIVESLVSSGAYLHISDHLSGRSIEMGAKTISK